MKISAKGQVTIPISLRKRFGLNPGTEIEFVVSKGALQVRPRNSAVSPVSRFDRWLTKAAGSAVSGTTTDQIMTHTR
jgi:AbrB family looped-hinge helix DNA binding protein